MDENSLVSMRVKLLAAEEKDCRIFSDFICKAAGSLGLKHTLTSLPWDVKRLTILRSPFVHKKKRTQLERRHYINQIEIMNVSKANIDRLSWYFKTNSPEDVIVEIEVSEFLSEKDILDSPEIPTEHLMVENPIVSKQQ